MELYKIEQGSKSDNLIYYVLADNKREILDHMSGNDFSGSEDSQDLPGYG